MNAPEKIAFLPDIQSQVGAYVVEAENFESIHNHSAFARIVRTSRASGGTGKVNRKLV